MIGNNTLGVVCVVQRDGKTVYMTPKRAREMAAMLLVLADRAEKDELAYPVNQEVRAGDA